MSSTRNLWQRSLLAGLMLAAGVAGTAAGQGAPCGNAAYDDGTMVAAWYFTDCFGSPDCMMGVRFSLADFGYQPGKVEITGFCAANDLDVGWGAVPNEVFIYPDLGGLPDDSVVLGHGTILTGNGTGATIVTLDEPAILYGDFWLMDRGHAPFVHTYFLLAADAARDAGHSYYSESGIAELKHVDEGGDYCLRAFLQPVERSVVTAGVAHASGASGSQWRSKLTVLNTSQVPTEATISYVHGTGIESETMTIAPGELVAWEDVVVELFGIAGESSGSVRVDADGPVLVTARTYNAGDAGTFGQFMPGVSNGEAMRSGQLGRLSLLSYTAAFRTNVGFINLGGQEAEVLVTLRDASGGTIGSTTLLVPAGAWTQQNDVFGAIGAGEVADGYAIVELLSDGAEVWGYASVIDNSTGDPTTVPLAIEGRGGQP